MDIDNNLKMTILIDTYGELLTNKQLDICKLYYFDNLSLAEIGELQSISRQAVNDALEKSKTLLEMYEQKIGKVRLIASVSQSLKGLEKKLKTTKDIDNLTKDINKIINNLD